MTDPPTERLASSADALAWQALRTHYVYQRVGSGIAVNLSLSALLVIASWKVVSHTLLAGWFLLLCAVSAWHLIARQQFLAAPGQLSGGEADRRMCWQVAASAAVWGIGTLMFLHGTTLEHQVMCLLVLAGLCAGGIVNLSPLVTAYRCYVPLMLAPFVLWCLTQDSVTYPTLAIMTIIFGVALLSAGAHFARHFNRAADLSGALARTEARFSGAFHHAPIGMFLVDVDGHVIDANQVAGAIFGTDAGYWRGRPFWSRAEAVDGARLRERFRALMADEIDDFRLDSRQLHLNATTLSVVVSASRLAAAGDGRLRGILQLQDVTATRTMADRLAFQATHDELTELINRRECEVRLAQAIEHICIDRTQHVVLYLDLDKFNLINESCGHAAGDALLHQTATLLRGVVRKHDVVARVGGDEFAIVLEHCSAKQAEGIAGTLIDALGAQRFRWDDKSFAGSVSIGLLALVSADVTVAGAMNAAAAACAAAKAHGGGRVYQFDADDAELTSYRQQVDSVAVIQRALDCDRFELHAQPIRALRAREVEPARRLEILLRMRDEHGTMISPALFLPAAERFGLAQRLDRWVIEHTCAWFALRPEAMDAIDSCAINLSGQSLTDPALAEFISSTFARHLLEPTKFCFEITETAAIACIAQARQLIESLRRRGFRFALDDFGSGLSSFGYLKALPVDVLKIDGVFIRHIATDPLDEAMVRAIAEVAHIMDKTTIAEFVESEAQVATLSRLGIDYLQGYLIGQPQPLANVIEALVGRRARTLRLVG